MCVLIITNSDMPRLIPPQLLLEIPVPVGAQEGQRKLFSMVIHTSQKDM